MNSTPIAIAMSGGVDSTACALLLCRDHRVCGFLMDIGQPNFVEQQQRVSHLAQRIGIDLRTYDLRQPFATLVLDYFAATYGAGMTPNPCIVCNHAIKFGLFMDCIVTAGFPIMATGHYARVVNQGDTPTLHRGQDRGKDQSYFLSRLNPRQLTRVRFPLGNMLKDDVYHLVENHGFKDFRGKESQDICFLHDHSVPSFLAAYSQKTAEPGPIITGDGTRIGTHSGVLHYTIGQRRGINLPHHEPWYVTAIAPRTNALVVGTAEDLFSSTLHARNSSWLIAPRPQPGGRFQVQIRSTHRGAAATIEAITDDSFSIRFDEPQRAIAPGQFAVIYDGDQVIGSGEIVSPHYEREES